MFTYLSIVGIAICGLLVLESQADPITVAPNDLGPMEVANSIGKMSEKYVPLTALDNQASSNAQLVAKFFRRLMKTGWGVIPPLDPVKEKDPLPLNIDNQEIQASVELSNFSLVGAKKYKVAQVEVRLDTQRLDFVIEIPLLTSDVDFHAHISVDNNNNTLSGHVNASLNNLVIEGALTFKHWPVADMFHQKMYIIAATYNLTSSNVQYNARNVEKKSQDPQYSSDVIKVIAQKIAQEAAHTNALAIIRLLNIGLNGYTVAQIISLLLPDES